MTASLIVPALCLSLAYGLLSVTAADADQVATQQWSDAIAISIERRDYRGGLPGANRQLGWQWHFKPSHTWSIDNGVLLLRADLPLYVDPPFWTVYETSSVWEMGRDYPDWLLRQSPQITAATGEFVRGHDHLADLTLDLAYGHVLPGRTLLFGIRSVFPTNEDHSNARREVLLGPDLFWIEGTGWGEVGARLTHVVNIAGHNTFPTSETNLQVLYRHRLNDRWQLISQPIIVYDWAADRGNRLMLPVGGGVVGVMTLAHKIWQVQFEYYRYTSTADRFGVSHLFKLEIAPRANSNE
ncbi:MAG: hypothetical protein QM808_08150 [Steroidobacteraceae bacterium]